ncbi:hypothetical protein D3C77_701920 [compost metagenome]
MGRQAPTVACFFSDIGQGHADPALARDDTPGGLQQALLGFGTTLDLGAARWGLIGVAHR